MPLTSSVGDRPGFDGHALDQLAQTPLLGSRAFTFLASTRPKCLLEHGAVGVVESREGRDDPGWRRGRHERQDRSKSEKVRNPGRSCV